ncbi:hypothetical protein AArc1_0330 [Natrarchaeobaculum sulfurireducens]|uniref:Uncharacterized protein n=1 Tax=Natrarchaeobaculum sulfurireducens TaxID=2044521 RepID=A0A346PAX9_9EURY|nr:hypothetical protein AArc1_0330 [Natrarchaeobaculum sulfurireducens]
MVCQLRIGCRGLAGVWKSAACSCATRPQSVSRRRNGGNRRQPSIELEYTVEDPAAGHDVPLESAHASVTE